MTPEIQTLAALAVVALAVTLLVRSALKKRQNPGAGCGGGCGCASGKADIKKLRERR